MVLTDSGGVQIEWHRNGVDVEIEIMPNGTIAWFVEIDHDQWSGDHVFAIGCDDPNRLRLAIKQAEGFDN